MIKMIVANTRLNNKFWKLKIVTAQICHKWRITHLPSAADVLKQRKVSADFLVLENLLLAMN